MLLQGCLLRRSVLLLQLHADIRMLLPRNYQLHAQGCLSLHISAPQSQIAEPVQSLLLMWHMS